MKGQSHPQRGPSQAQLSGGGAKTGMGEGSRLRDGGWGLGGPGVALGRAWCPAAHPHCLSIRGHGIRRQGQKEQ